jgi:uncharacterized membrane protein YdbT with pleckstrin-like domain
VRPEPKIDRYLLPTEQRVFAVRRHWIALMPMLALYGTFVLGGLLAIWLVSGSGFPEAVAISFVIFTMLWMLWLFGDWYVERFVVTNRRVLLITGLLNRKVAIMPLIKVTDLTFEQSVWGRMLHYGTFIVESAGQDQALSRIDYLAHPLQRYREVSALLFGTNVGPDPEDVPSKHDTAPIPTVPPRRRH